MIVAQVPFYASDLGYNGSFRSVIRMVLKYFLPQREFSWEDVEKLTGEKKGERNWPMQGLISLEGMGFDLFEWSDFDYFEFMTMGEDYLIKRCGKGIAKTEAKHNNLEPAQKIAKEYLVSGIHTKKIPEIKEVKRLLDQGYLVCCKVNGHALNNLKGYLKHFVLVVGYTSQNLYLHDPGPSPSRNRRVPIGSFTKAWEYPDKVSKNLIGFKYPRAF